MRSALSLRNVTRHSPSVSGKKDDAEAYSQKTYPEVLKALSKVIEGAPQVETFEVSNSTSHQIAASAVT
jgi:hypothetical protein